VRVAGNELIVDFEAKKTGFELCYEISQSERIASQRLPSLELPARRLLMKGIAGVAAALASSSLSPAIAAQTQSHQPEAPGNQVPPVQDGWGPFTPSSGAGRYLQLVYPPSTTKGELQLGVIYTLWIPDDIKTVRAVIVHQHGASIPAAQAGATSTYDLHWQALAKKWNCVLLGPSYRVLNDAIDLTPGGAELWFDPRQGSERVFLRALDEFATKSGPRGNRYGPLVSLGALWWRDMGQCNEHSPPRPSTCCFSSFGYCGDVSSEARIHSA